MGCKCSVSTQGHGQHTHHTHKDELKRVKTGASDAKGAAAKPPPGNAKRQQEVAPKINKRKAMEAAAKYSASVTWHIRSHQLTGDNSELVSLQRFARLLPHELHRYNVGDKVYCLDPIDLSLRGVQGTIQGILITDGDVHYYICYDSDKSEMPTERDVSFLKMARAIKKTPLPDKVLPTMHMVDSEWEAHSSDDGSNRSENEVYTDANKHQLLASTIGELSKRGEEQADHHADVFHRDTSPDSPGGHSQGPDEEFRYLTIRSEAPQAHEWEDALRSLPPESVGLDEDVFEVLFSDTKPKDWWEG